MTGAVELWGPLAGHRLRDDPVSGAAFRELRVGDRTLYAVSDGFLLMAPEMVGTPDHRTAGHDALRAVYGEVRLPVGCFLLPGEPTVLVDTGMGPVDFGGRGTLIGGNLLPQLARIGVRPDDVDVVALSHLHGDHCGGLADPSTGEPVFGRARTLVGDTDWSYFVERGHGVVPVADHVRQALLELDRRGLVTLVSGDTEIAPGVQRLAAPGHTPGHSVYAVHDGGERLLLVGDSAHCPAQLRHVDWSVAFDVEPSSARRHREWLRNELRSAGVIGALGSHFPEFRLVTADDV